MSLHPVLQRALDDARAGHLDVALASARRFVQRQPRDVSGLQVLGTLALQAGLGEQAEHALARAVAIEPRMAPLRNSYGNILLQRRKAAEAVGQLRTAIEIDPGYAHGWLGLACVLSDMSDFDNAIAAAKRGLNLRPDWPDLHNNLILALEHSGQLEEAVAAAREAHRLFPGDVSIHSVLLLLLNYTSEPAQAIAAEHRRFGRASASQVAAPRTSPEPERRLRIGVLSSDLKTHSVGYFAWALFESSPDWVDIVVFSLAPAVQDPMADFFKSRAAAWIEIGQASDAAIDARIREERIDILLELNGHSGLAHPGCLLRKPAPIIVSGIGYPNTTGIAAVDWRLVDSITDPAGSESLASEQLLRLDPCFLCYRPPTETPEPRLCEGPTTFGSFNQLSKIGPETCRLWAGALERVPGSRLLMKSRGMSDAGALARVRERIEAAGVDPGRVEIVPSTPTIREHLDSYSRVHIALDTSPYNGTTTTCEALWMGVPVVSFAGDRHAARVGASLLAAAGRPEWVAGSEDEYTHIAAVLAGNRSELALLRDTLRVAMHGSALCDGPAYASRFYSALRERWREYCQRGAS